MTTAKNSQEEREAQNGRREDSLQDAAQAWGSFYQQMADEGMDFFRKGMEIAQQASPFALGGGVYKQWMDNYYAFVNRVMEESSAPMDTKEGYRRFYDAWLDVWTRGMESYMQTPEFAARSGKHMENVSDLTKRTGEIMEAYWHSVHLPSSHDMREIYHKLYLIERKLDEMDRRMRQATETSAAKTSSAPAKKSEK